MTCKRCTHLRKPGRENEYCAGRDDLPPAYGLNHPLHELPQDKGAKCGAYEMHPAYWVPKEE